MSTPPDTKRCDLCHESISIHEFDDHYKQHQGTEEDGQLSTYPTLPPEQRWKGDLSTVPQKYIHDACGAVTGMPEDIIRTYMVNPYFYGYSSFCCGCETHVSAKELKWVETDVTLFEHSKMLQAEIPDAKRYRNELILNSIVVSLIGGVILGLICGVVIYIIDRHLVGSLVAAALGCFCGWLLSLSAIYNVRGGI